MQVVTQTEASDYFIEPLSSHHNRADFESGVELLDRYFQHQARQDAKKRVAAKFGSCAQTSLQAKKTKAMKAMAREASPSRLVHLIRSGGMQVNLTL